MVGMFVYDGWLCCLIGLGKLLIVVLVIGGLCYGVFSGFWGIGVWCVVWCCLMGLLFVIVWLVYCWFGLLWIVVFLVCSVCCVWYCWYWIDRIWWLVGLFVVWWCILLFCSVEIFWCWCGSWLCCCWGWVWVCRWWMWWCFCLGLICWFGWGFFFRYSGYIRLVVVWWRCWLCWLCWWVIILMWGWFWKILLLFFFCILCYECFECGLVLLYVEWYVVG